MTSHPPADSAGEDLATVEGVSPLELFFDLVFVFALTQITAVLASDATWNGYAHGLAVLGLVWLVWVGYTWLGNARSSQDTEMGLWDWRRPVYVVAMILMLVIGITTSKAFDQNDAIFAVTYLLLGLLLMASYLYTARGDKDMRRAILRVFYGALVLGAMLIIGAFVEQPQLEFAAVWVGLVLAYATPLLFSPSGWVVSTAHADERFSLFIILALGESFIATGFGAVKGTLGPDTIAVLALAVVLSTTLWWTYFAAVAHAGRTYLNALTPVERARQARVIYTYLHGLMVVGIVFLALGLKQTAESPREALEPLVSLALLGGIAVYCIALVLFSAVIGRPAQRWSLVAVVLLLLLIPVGMALPAVATLALADIVMVVTTVLLARSVTGHAATR